jgi:CheY-like chemotaxis protein
VANCCDETIRDTLRDIVQEDGHEALEAPDGAAALEALEALRSHRKQLIVLLDNVMPGLEGMTVLETIAADSELRDRHRYLLITASPQRLSESERAVLETLDVPVIGTPFDLETLSQQFAVAQARLAAAVGAEPDDATPPRAS